MINQIKYCSFGILSIIILVALWLPTSICLLLSKLKFFVKKYDSLVDYFQDISYDLYLITKEKKE